MAPSYTRKRNYLPKPASPPKLRPFDELEDLYVQDLELEQARIQRIEREKELKKDIRRQVNQLASEEWLMRGLGGFSGPLANL